jgi:predicted nucleic acid-binding Zn ribbon protein
MSANFSYGSKRFTTQACFGCGRPFLGGRGRFCSDGCVTWFDLGGAPYTAEPDPAALYGMPLAPFGFERVCPACGQAFDSKGLRACSTECENKIRARENGELDDIGGRRW